MPRLNLAVELAVEGALTHASKIALREPTRTWTYAELADEVARVAGALVTLGVKPGERVAILMPDGLDAAASILGAIYMGAVAVPLSELGRPNDVRALVRDAGAVAAIVHHTLEPVLDEVRPEITTLREVIAVGGARGTERSFEDIVAGSKPIPPHDSDGADPALLLYSAGPSERAPRGVPHAHQTPMASFDAYARGIVKLVDDDRVFSVVKLSTAYGLGAGLVFPLAARCESLLLPDQARSPNVLGMLDALKPTVMFATPSIYSQLLADVRKTNAHARFSSLRVCVSGAETLPGSLAERLTKHLGLEVLSGYGLTEAFHFVIATPPGETRPGASGKVIPGFEARVVDDLGVAAGPHEIGTLEVRGPTVAREYWNCPDDSRKTFQGEWLHTGDRFFADGEGYFFHCGRVDGLFKVSGRWVSPEEVEQTLLRHEAVWECAVVGVDDENGLVKPLAYVVPNVGHAGGLALERELIEFVKREIAPYKYPRWIEFVDALPKGESGKILRYKLPARRPPRQRMPTAPAL